MTSPIAALLLCTVALTATVTSVQIPQCDNRSVIVHLFEWKWTDVKAECRAFLAPKGYCAAQVSPPSEHVVLPDNPWSQRYQPVSYVLNSSSGTLEEFQQMVNSCNAVGVRIIAEVVLNNMASMRSKGTGFAGSAYDASRLSFPAVPYDENDFNNASLCVPNQSIYNEAEKKRNCPVYGRADLDQSRENVRNTMRTYLDRLVDLGVVGFSVTSADDMWPRDLAAILTSVKSLPGGLRPFFLLDVADFGRGAVRATEYTDLGFVTEYRFAGKVVAGLSDFTRLASVVNYTSGMIRSQHAVVFIDTYATQRFVAPGTLTFHRRPDYTMATAFALAYGYGTVRVMSSYDFNHTGQGPPMGADNKPQDVTVDEDGQCLNDWVCEHRWPVIFHLIPFHNTVNDKDVNHFTATSQVVAFTRGRTGFFAMIPLGSNFVGIVPTGLAPGNYCDEISDCSHRVQIDSQGRAHLTMSSLSNPVLAILNPAEIVNPFKRTVCLLEKITQPGENLFFRGGLDKSRREGCTEDAETSQCAIPIFQRKVDVGLTEASIAWRFGDNFLDWYGKEINQGVYNDLQPQGSPGIWTTNNVTDDINFCPLNSFGSHYWLLDVDMDCSKTDQGFFEFKAIVNGQWENDMTNNQCDGFEPLPFTSVNHVAKCGALNVFHWNEGRCESRDL